MARGSADHQQRCRENPREHPVRGSAALKNSAVEDAAKRALFRLCRLSYSLLKQAAHFTVRVCCGLRAGSSAGSCDDGCRSFDYVIE